MTYIRTSQRRTYERLRDVHTNVSETYIRTSQRRKYERLRDVHTNISETYIRTSQRRTYTKRKFEQRLSQVFLLGRVILGLLSAAFGLKNNFSTEPLMDQQEFPITALIVCEMGEKCSKRDSIYDLSCCDREMRKSCSCCYRCA